MGPRFDIDEESAEKLLLTSLDSFWSIIEPLMAAIQPRRVCEIGIGNGLFTKRLIEYCQSGQAEYIGIDPSTGDEFVEKHSSDGAHFVREPSLTALIRLKDLDLCFVDGDHNYYTVGNELDLIVSGSPDIPLIMLHDTAWPWARRDQYCDPDAIPSEHRHEHSKKLKVSPDSSDLTDEGFSGESSDYHYAAAIREGGGRNGVLTAAEDFIAAQGDADWRMILVPAVFGLGILYAPEKVSADTAALLEDLQATNSHYGELLHRMERNRIELFLGFNKNIDHIRELASEYGLLSDQYKALREHERGLAKHAADLLEAYKDLRKYADRLEEQVRDLQNLDGE